MQYITPILVLLTIDQAGLVSTRKCGLSYTVENNDDRKNNNNVSVIKRSEISVFGKFDANPKDDVVANNATIFKQTAKVSSNMRKLSISNKKVVKRFNTKKILRIFNRNNKLEEEIKKKTQNCDVIDDKTGKTSATTKYCAGNSPYKKRVKREDDVCTRLYKKVSVVEHQSKMKLFVQNKEKKLYVYSTERATSKALAALLVAAIRYRAGYDQVYLETNNSSLSEFTQAVQFYDRTKLMTDDKVYIHVDVDWDKKAGEDVALPGCIPESYTCSIAGTRLADFGRSPSVNVRLYAVWSNNCLERKNCAEIYRYFDFQDLKICGFFEQFNNSICVPVLITPDVKTKLATNLNHFEEDEIKLCNYAVISRADLSRRLKDENSSFIFIDYDLDYDKTENHRVRIIQLPPRILQETITALQVADIYTFRSSSPYILDVLNAMRPKSEDLREILKINEDHTNIIYAACAWANTNEEKFKNMSRINIVKTIFVYVLCNNSELADYKEFIRDIIIKNLTNYIEEKIINLDFVSLTVDCGDKSSIGDRVSELKRHTDWSSMIGIAVPGLAADIIKKTIEDVQIVSYDVPLLKTGAGNALSTISGDLLTLVSTISHFLKKYNWSRLAIISEKSSVAESFTDKLHNHLQQFKEAILQTVNISSIIEILNKFQKINAKVIFVNTNSETANLIACEATKLGMADAIGYAWIVREWRPSKVCASNIQVITVSYWWRGGNDSVLKDGDTRIRQFIDNKYKNKTWPVLAAPLVDATLLMMYRVLNTFRTNSESYSNRHSPEIVRNYNTYQYDIDGVAQKLKQSNNTLLNPLVFVTAWRGRANSLIAVWRVMSETQEIIEVNLVKELYDGSKSPDDYKFRCLTTKSGDDFYPHCHDGYWFSAIVILLVIIIVLWRVCRCWKENIIKEKNQTLMRLLSRCEKTAAVLEPFLVDRAKLELYEELGSGHFGRVRFGMLRASGRPPTPVAAKTLREDAAPAEEAEFLREASNMANLKHDHVVRLVGVCADMIGPPLLLMDHAFFGDLLKYLRKRRHLVEVNERDSCISAEVLKESRLDKSLDPEARHVSPVELTRLGREAADALDYLATQHLVHRDVRASNCLVDERRVLKLADFGMARNVEQKNKCPLDEAEGSDDYQYICRRRGVFPVSWMAPESLDRGEFSRASDVWALGVLMLEISTLGARPYGAWKPLEVFRYVRSGGRPPLPRDASYHTCEITEMCWNESPSSRATAKEISEYLQNHPTALRGALRPAWPEPDLVPDSSDSGFGEKDPDHEWSKDVDLRVSTL